MCYITINVHIPLSLIPSLKRVKRFKQVHRFQRVLEVKRYGETFKRPRCETCKRLRRNFQTGKVPGCVVRDDDTGPLDYAIVLFMSLLWNTSHFSEIRLISSKYV